jgi:hypothetical protein
MGDAKRRKLVDELTRRLIDDGRIIEAGWMSFRIMCLPDDAPEIQVAEMRNAFFAGAQHLFGSITSMLDADADPTEADLAGWTRLPVSWMGSSRNSSFAKWMRAAVPDAESQQQQLADYLADHYGQCRQLGACSCRAQGRWLGRRCPEWVPCGATNWAEFQIEIGKFFGAPKRLEN